MPSIPQNVFFTSKEEAETVLKHMSDIISEFKSVSVNDFHDLVGLPSVYEDSKWGWTELIFATIKQADKGYLLNLPSVKPI